VPENSARQTNALCALTQCAGGQMPGPIGKKCRAALIVTHASLVLAGRNELRKQFFF